MSRDVIVNRGNKTEHDISLSSVVSNQRFTVIVFIIDQKWDHKHIFMSRFMYIHFRRFINIMRYMQISI